MFNVLSSLVDEINMSMLKCHEESNTNRAYLEKQSS